MSARDLKWLRGFIDLGARAGKDGILKEDILRQERTVLLALKILESRPGVVLADEVGMGKTYEALGVAAAMLQVNRKSKVVVVTPGPDLNGKWIDEFRRFGDIYDFGDFVAAKQLPEFVAAVRKHSVVVAPVTMFQSGRGAWDQAYLLSLYCYWKGLHGNTSRAIMNRFRDGRHELIKVEHEKFLDVFDLDRVYRHLGQAFGRGHGSGAAGLDDLFEAQGLEGFDRPEALKRALNRARFVLTGKLIPHVDLLIVDEAHKLKNPGSVRTSAMRLAFQKRFSKVLFLTATPFQLEVAEFREVFELFKLAKGAPEDLSERVDELLDAISEYQQRYDDFQLAWSALDPLMAAEFRSAYGRDGVQFDDPSLQMVGKQVAGLKRLKEDVIQPGMRRWMIRSLRKDKRNYRRHEPKKISPSGAEALPFLVYERFIAELFRRQRRTHKAQVEINMVSSYTAALGGSILSGEDRVPREAEAYRQLLREVLAEIERAQDHPKLKEVVSDALSAAERGEKTLIFCTRIATLEQLRREMDAIWESLVLNEWRCVYPGADVFDIFDTPDDEIRKRQGGRHALLRTRFHRSQDLLCLALREPYCRTLVDLADWASGRLPDIMKEANFLLANQRLSRTSAKRVDYLVAKRCIEQASARLRLGEDGDTGGADAPLALLADERFVELGLDLEADELESAVGGTHRPKWEISPRVAEIVLGRPGGLWSLIGDPLARLDPSLRVAVVEQLGRYLTRKQVPFLAQLLSEAKHAGLAIDPVESMALFEFMPRFWGTSVGKVWLDTLRAFLSYFVERDPSQQQDLLHGPIQTGRFARHTGDGESRERLREAFNTPLFPMVLIANEVMQEGLDLHRQCKRVIHHDLVWNPAQIEQRIGRIDRLGSLTHRMRMDGVDAMLEVLYPVVRGTIDERIYRTVKNREKWLEFLLGATPDLSQYSFGDKEPPPLPEGLGAELAIDLSP